MNKPEKTRIDIYLVQKGFAPSRNKAQELIQNGLVSLQRDDTIVQVLSPSELVDDIKAPKIILQKSLLDKYVSRAGVKLSGALDHLKFSVDRLDALDVVIS